MALFVLEFRSSYSPLPTDRRTNTNGSGVNLQGKAAPLTPRFVMLIILPALLLCSHLSTHPLEAGELLLVPKASLFPPRTRPHPLATWRVTPYFIPAPVEAVDMLRGVCVNGFCSISLGSDVGSGSLGWGQAAVFVCSLSSADKRRVSHRCCHQAHSMPHGVLRVWEPCSGRAVSDRLGKDISFLAQAGVLLPGFVTK